MPELFLIAAAVLAGLDWRAVALVALSLLLPVWALVLVGLHILRSRRRDSTRSAVFCQSVVRELRSGAPFRTALAEAARVVGAEQVTALAESGEPLSDLATPLAQQFPEIGDEIAAIVEAVSRSGAPAGSLFEELGDLALAHVEMSEEVRVATAPARASALVLIGLPAAYLGYQLSRGDTGLFATGSQRLVAGVGVALVGLGLSIAVLLVRRSV